MNAPRRSRPVVGVLTSRLLELFEEQWLGSVDAAAALDCDLITFIGRELDPSGGDRTRANAIYDLVSSHSLDALVIWTQTLDLHVGHERMEEFCRRFAPLPIVSIEQELGDSPVVLMENRGGMREVVNHLIEVHGRRRIAFVRGPANHTGAQDRFQGYLDALAAHGLAADPALISAPAASWEPEVAAGITNRLLDQADTVQPDAIVAANDDLAIGVLSALDARRVRTPDDVAVVGFDDHTNIRNHDVGFESTEDETGAVRRSVNVSSSTLSLTTVRGPFHAMGWSGVELALARLRGDPVPPVVTIPTQLVVRRSCGCFPTWVEQAPQVATTPTTGVRLNGTLLQPFTSTPALPADWSDQLTAAYLRETQGGPAGEFLRILDGFVRASMRAGASIESWWPALFRLREQSHPALTTEPARNRADDIWLRVQLLMNEASQRSWRYTQLLAEKRNQIVREVGQRLITAPDVEGLAEALTEELPRVGLPSCYLASYEAEPPLARTLLAYEGGERVELGPEEALFSSSELVPDGLLQHDRRVSLVAAPLYFKDDQLGFVLFELGPRIGWIYEALQEQVASALQGALMVQRERHALAAVEDARQSLEMAHVGLERRVADRTAELARANEVLKEQIIERERAEERLRHAQKMEAIGRLAGGIAHDFNNLLVVINGNSDMLLRQIPESDPIREDVADIHYAGERGAKLTRQLLAFSRQQVLHPEQVDVNEVVADIEVMLQRLAGESVELLTHLSPTVPRIWADAGQIEQMIFNLCVNARDAIADGGTITIETANVTHEPGSSTGPVGLGPGDYVMLRISDTGSGMDDTTQARIFEPFFTTKPTGQGTGLGLATVFGIVEQSGGHIAVASAPGAGATFEVYLPRAEQTAAAPSEAGPADAPLTGTETILLVEDDSRVRTTARRFLSDFGYQVLEAVDGHDALRVAEQHDGPLHLVITDIGMPGMGGRDLAKRLAGPRPDTPVLYVSGYTDSSSLRSELTDASAALLHKPFTAIELAERVREILDRRRPG